MSAPVAPSPLHSPVQAGVLVLVGAGYAHLQLLTRLAQRPLEGVRVIWVHPLAQQMHAPMLPGFVAGHYAWGDCTIPLEPLARHANARCLERQVLALDATQRVLTLDDGSTLRYDWLSVNTEGVQEREQLERAMPGARTHGLFVRPFDVFAKLWPRVVELGSQRALRIAIISAGTVGVELACAVRSSIPSAAITLLMQPIPWDEHCPSAVRNRLRIALKKQGITVLHDAVVSIEATQVHLASGASLACDVPLVAVGVQPPAWLVNSGLALDAQGDLLGDLHAVTQGQTPPPNAPAQRRLALWFGGSRYSVASWGTFSTQGFGVWWLKHWLDRSFVVKHTKGRS